MARNIARSAQAGQTAGRARAGGVAPARPRCYTARVERVERAVWARQSTICIAAPAAS